MITCKEGLLNTYIINDKGSLRDAYLGKLKEFGFEWYLQSKTPKQHHLNAFEILVNADNKIDWNDKVNGGMKSRKQLTLSDFKPTRTEYVKVTDSIFDLKAELEAGELYCQLLGNSGEYRALEEELSLIDEFKDGNIYRKVEREITWRDEVLCDFALWSEGGKVGMNGNFSEENFIEMCHKVYHLTK